MPESTGLERRILMTKNPADFRTRQVRVTRTSDNVYVEPEGPEIDFKTMSGYRKPVPVEVIQQDIDSGRGHLFANMGVSAYLVMKHGQDEYLVTVGQIRKSEGFSDKVAKLVSGYVDAEYLTYPLGAIINEIAEEFLPVTYAGKFLSGRFEGLWLPQPYKEVAEYERNNPFSLSPRYDGIYGTDFLRNVFVQSKPAMASPKLYYHANVNGAQLVYPLSVQVDLESIEGLSQAETDVKKPAHIKHAEDKFEKGVLNTYMDPLPLYLLKLAVGGKITGEVFTFCSGKLQKIDAEGLILSEAFVPAVNHGIIGANNITLKDYLAQK